MSFKNIIGVLNCSQGVDQKKRLSTILTNMLDHWYLEKIGTWTPMKAKKRLKKILEKVVPPAVLAEIFRQEADDEVTPTVNLDTIEASSL